MRIDVKVLQMFIDDMVGIPKFSYPARQNNAPRPKGEFAHIRLLEEYPVGIPSQYMVAQDESTTTYKIVSPTRLRFRVGVADTTGLPASKIMHKWNSETMKALMMKTGYGFIKCTPISNEDALLEKEWETRVGFSVELYATRAFEEVVDNISAVQISSEFVTEQQDSVLSNIEVNE
jgi:hypothetical protein